ncbi:MAG: PHP domain-containing protein, partial [Stellaceae bacterium]
MTRYAELQVTSNFSFLRGASHPEELVAQAKALGHAAIAITDRNSLAGIVRAHVAAEKHGLRLVVGCRLDLLDGCSLLCFPSDRAAYGRLTRLLTRGKRRANKGECRIFYDDLVEFGEGQILIALPSENFPVVPAKAGVTPANRPPDGRPEQAGGLFGGVTQGNGASHALDSRFRGNDDK